MWVVGLEGRSTAGDRRRRRTCHRRARTLAAQWGCIGGIPALQRRQRGGQMDEWSTVSSGTVEAAPGVVEINDPLLLQRRPAPAQFRRTAAPRAPARGWNDQ